ncbi:MAG TPA: glycosyltransferase [Verrucomicrobiae bacterium]|nr:glycosyltransferase [Verrucomicrobiae bacterium]
MSDTLPSVTVIIPARPDETEVQAALAARRLDYPVDRLEIILARGKQPSVQRNTALRSAQGELIYFLDDDSIPQQDNLRRAVNRFADSKVQVLGGPNLCPPDAPELEQIFALVLSSLAFGPSRARYTKVGQVRASSEKELILCNMMARRDTLLKHGGFNEALYPNEENALMDEIQKEGGTLMYDPDFVVFRRPRRTLGAFFRMLRTYGRGRAEQFRETPTFGSVLNFVPPLFLVYLVTLLALWVVPRAGAAESVRGLYSLLLLFYGIIVLAQTAALAPVGGFLRALCAMPLIALTPVLYGYGFWRGLFTKLKPQGERSNVAVKLETVRAGDNYPSP